MNLDRVEVSDCRAWLAKLPEDSIDLLMTSPPYWSSRSYASTLERVWGGNADCQHNWLSRGVCANCGAWKGELGLEPTQKMYVAHLLEVFRLVKKVLKSTGSLYLNLAKTDSTTLGRRSEVDGGIPGRVEHGLLDEGWVLVDKSTWQKPNPKSSSLKSRPMNSYELLFHFVKNRKTLLWRNAETGEWTGKRPTKPNRDIKTDADRRRWRQLWQPFAYYFDLDAISELQDHRSPADSDTLGGQTQGRQTIIPQFEAFPEEFCLRPILTSSPPTGIVADPFAGSGTALLVAKKSGRHYVGCDLNPACVKLARRRLSVARSQVSRAGRKMSSLSYF